MAGLSVGREGPCIQLGASTAQDMALPFGSLVVAIRRHYGDITPNGDTVIHGNDTLVILTSLRDESKVKEILRECTEEE